MANIFLAAMLIPGSKLLIRKIVEYNYLLECFTTLNFEVKRRKTYLTAMSKEKVLQFF